MKHHRVADYDAYGRVCHRVAGTEPGQFDLEPESRWLTCRNGQHRLCGIIRTGDQAVGVTDSLGCGTDGW